MSIYNTLVKIPILKEFALSVYIKRSKLEFTCDGEVFKENLEKSRKLFLTESQLNDKAYMKKNLYDIVYSYVKYLSSPFEYFVYDFEHKSDAERATYITSKYRLYALMGVSGKAIKDELKDKFFFYGKMKSFFKRDAILIKSPEDFSAFKAFCEVHKSFIAKNNTGSLGIGTDIYTIDNNEKELFDSFISEGEWIIEELIEQSEEMSVWNPSSVNTIRISTFMTKDGLKHLPPIMRSGRKGSCVDNAGSGGICVVLDRETGVAVTDGYDKVGNSYKSHPDSGVLYEGWRIPQWEELLATVKTCHEQLPGHKFIGWDFALSKKGWVLVEGNWSQQFAWQICTQQGHRPEFDELLFG